ncbi:hypothetical protein M413DRAFT_12710 [Hebeloma cylindrosporum]|uniref:DUF6532 domain-containing protein n=1 Tax=Hebeloma cylindrosporum TaxID=76867 RepID=A0A0C3C2H5_HEBCY|nr:hypothetical protein M413DRAFT_12710 [Hebeloma cylindrosporum h7]
MATPSHRTYAQAAASKSSQPLLERPRNAAAPRSSINSPSSTRPIASATTGNVKDKAPRVSQLSSTSVAATKTSQEKENLTTRTTRERRPSEKIVASRAEREEAARQQEILDMNRAERAKRAQRKKDKANGADRLAQSDDEARPDIAFTSQVVVTKANAQKAALVQRQTKSHSRSGQHDHQEMSPPMDESGAGPVSPVNSHGKRARSPEDDAVDEITFVKAQKVTEGGGRPKASDYDEVAKQVILTATGVYRCLISTMNAFPTPSEEASMIRAAWDRANVETAQEVPIALSPVIAKVISARGSQIRSEVKAHAVTYVEALYGFESGRGKSIIKTNRQVAEQLKQNHSGYLYKASSFFIHFDLEKKSGLYQHPIIQKIVNKSWFNNPRDEGIVYVDLFDPLSVEAIALVLTAIECGIDSWATGVKIEVPFYTSEYKPIYTRHATTLKAFGVATSKHDLLGKLQRTLFNFGRIHAGVPSTMSQNGPMLSDSAFAAALREYEDDTETEEDGKDVD